MKLQELIHQATPLPWPEYRFHESAPDFGAIPNYILARHAVSVLPELIKAAREFQQMVERTEGSHTSRRRLDAALAAAEELQ